MTEDAADWAARYANQVFQHYADPTKTSFPFNGKWDEFIKEFKTRFGSLNEESEARKEIQGKDGKGMKQGKQTVAQFAQKFQDVGSRTGFSNADLMEQFCNRLNHGIRLHMVSINIAQGKLKSLTQAILWAIKIELALHDPTYNTTSNRRTDPNAMDVDAA